MKRLQIKNFRIHEKLDIRFSPFVNSIIGRNAVGKSTIIRAIKWVAMNRPTGDLIINWNADKAAVRLTIDENKITRTRGKGTNTYKLNKDKPYKAFRNDVPEDIEKIINLSNINFQGQHEAPFWFCETAGEVSRQLNSIVNLEGIDNALKNITSALHKSRTVIEVVKSRLDELEIKQKSLAYIEEKNKDLEKVESLQNRYQEKTVELSTINEKIKLVYLHRSKRETALELTRDAKTALLKGQKYRKIAIQIENLSKTIDSVEKVGRRKCRIEEELERRKKELLSIIGKQCPLCGQEIRRS